MSTYYVDDDAKAGGNGSINRPLNNLSQAINKLKDGDTIHLANGIYSGEKTITENKITIIGEGSKTIINGGAHYGLRVMGDNFVMDSIRITGSKEAGFQAIDTYGVTLKNSWFDHNQGLGVYLRGGDWYNITNNVMSYNGETVVVPGIKPNGGGLSIHNPHSKTAGWDGRNHIVVQGNSFHHNDGTVKTTENHGFILDFYTQSEPRIANPWNYKQNILVRYNDSAWNGKSGFIVHMADQKGAVNPDFTTFEGNRAWNNGQDNIPNSSDFRSNSSDGIKYINNMAYDNGAMGDDHFSYHIGSSTEIYMEDNYGSSALSRPNSTIKSGGGNFFNDDNLTDHGWSDSGRAHWLNIQEAKEMLQDNHLHVDTNQLDWG